MSVDPFVIYNAKLDVTGRISDVAYYNLRTVTYYAIEYNFFKVNGDLDYIAIQKILHNPSGLGNGISKGIFHKLVSNSPINVSRVCIGTNIVHGIYGLFSTPKKVDFKVKKDSEGREILPENMKEEVEFILEQINGAEDSNKQPIFKSIDLDDNIPPNQKEGGTDPKLIDDLYYVSINPPPNTVRRTLVYANYIADGNTSMDAPAGRGKRSSYTLSGWHANWFVDGEMRRLWDWPRRLRGGLSADDLPPCMHTELGNSAVTNTPTWKGIETFKKLENSVAFIPSELFGWPGSSLYTFYSVSGYVDENKAANARGLGTGWLFPFIFTSPISAMGFSSVIFENLRKYVQTTQYFSLYARPYQDDSDGSGIWHQIA